MGSGADTVSGEQRDGLGDTGCGSGGRSVAEEPVRRLSSRALKNSLEEIPHQAAQDRQQQERC